MILKMIRKHFLIIILASIILRSMLTITQTVKAEQITSTTPTAHIDNYKAVSRSSFVGVKQIREDVLTTTSSILITAETTTTTTIQPKTLLMPVEQKLMIITGEMVISDANPSYFNKSSLQKHYQQQQKQQQEQKEEEGAQKQKQQGQNHQHHQVLKMLPTSSTPRPQQRHNNNDQYTFDDNKHPPCDDNEHAANSIDNMAKSTDATSISISLGNHSKSPQIGATAKGYEPLVSTSNSFDSVENNGSINGSIGAFGSSSSLLSSRTMATVNTMTTMMATTTTTTAFNVARNGFRDKINISNQRNEFSNVDDDSSTNELFDNAVVAKVQQQQKQQQEEKPLQLHRKYKRSTITTTTTTETEATATNEAESSFFERAELLESNMSPDEHHELLLHRRKRYLVFPEGSSFQLVFDLIIGGVDYSSYLILGITVAIAWELPDKTPSEIIEDFENKVSDGTFGLQRRNDTITKGGLQYVNTNKGSSVPQNATKSIPSTAAAAAPTKFANFPNDENEWKPQFTVSNYYNKPTPIASSYNKGISSSSSGSSSRNYYSYGLGRDDDFAAAPRGDNFAVETQRKSFNEKRPPMLLPSLPQHTNNWYKNFPKLNTNTKYYKNYYSNKNYNNNKNVWNFDDKRKFGTPTAAVAVDWHRQRQQQQKQQQQNPYRQHQRLHTSSGSRGSSSTSKTDGFFDKVDASDNDDYMPDRFGPYHGKQQTNYAGAWQQKDNWWQRNKQRLKNKWQDKQQAWAKYTKEYDDEPTWNGPTTNYARHFHNSNNDNFHSYRRTGRQRKILKERPQHRVYPVFGRRRRSVPLEELPLTPLEVKLEGTHFREQLKSRLKLFGKIEQVFNTRGYNGTECVLRALCETGHRQHQQNELDEHQLYHNDDDGGNDYNGQYQHQQHPNNRQPHSTAGQHREPQSFITELLRAIFALPRDTGGDTRRDSGSASGSGNTRNENGRRKRTTLASEHSYDAGSSTSASSQLDLEFELQQHRRLEFESQIPWHYRDAHTYDGNCALRFADCELSIWEDMAAFDNGSDKG